MLVLQPTDHNKILTQWKGPFEVSAGVRVNDCKVSVKRKGENIPCQPTKEVF